MTEDMEKYGGIKERVSKKQVPKNIRAKAKKNLYTTMMGTKKKKKTSMRISSAHVCNALFYITVNLLSIIINLSRSFAGHIE